MAVCQPPLDFAAKSQGGLFQQGIEVVREEGFRQVVPVSGLTALLVIRASPEAAHRDSERLRVDLADQLPAIPVRESYVTDQDIEFRIRERLYGGSHVPDAADLMPLVLQILRQVGQRVFMVFDNKDSQAT